MSKRRHEGDHGANVLRQRIKQDELWKAKLGQRTLQILMNPATRKGLHESSNVEENTINTNSPSYKCHRCNNTSTLAVNCNFCEHLICNNCIQQCLACEGMYCGVCSIIDYSTYIERVFCLSCKMN